MAAPLPDPAAPPPRGAAVRGVVIGVAGLVVLGAGAWLALREPPAPPGAPPAPAPVAAAPAPLPSPAVPAPAATPLAAAPAPVAAAPAPVAPPAAAPAPAPAAPAPAAPVAAAPPAAAPSPPAPSPPPAIAAAPSPPAPPPAPLPVPAPAPAAPAVVLPRAPQFDIVRVSPAGGVVAAGRAEPGAQVILRANGREIGRVRADAQGQWAFAGAPPLPPGAHEITLAALDPAGRETAGAGAVEAVVAAPAPPPAHPPAAVAQAPAAPPAPASAPAPAQAPSPTPAPAAPIVVLTTPQGAPVLLQAPGRQGGGRLGLDIVDYSEGGDIRFAGTAPAGATIRVYVNDAHVGDTVTGPDGRWSLAPAADVAQGEHRLRLDQLDGAGRVAARAEQPFQRAAVAALDPGVQRVVVQPRQNLWRIARRAYGQGVRYTEIYAANRDVIRDPARIYPGQVFTIPAAPAGAPAGAGASTPASASRSR